MNAFHQSKTPFVASWFIAVLIIIASCIGLFLPETYSKETPNWFAQTIGQDMVNLLLIVPFLTIASILAYQGNKTGLLLWSGAIVYLNYTYVIYCFDVHFNSLFFIYCLILGLSFYSLIYFLVEQIKNPVIKKAYNPIVLRVTGIYFIVTACVFYLLWLSVIIPAIINGTIPNSLLETGLVTNPIHVLDLAVCLPGLFIVGIMVIKRKSLGLVMAPALLVFCILMNITIGSLAVVMKVNGLTENLFIILVMAVLVLFSIALLYFYLKNIEGLVSQKKTLAIDGPDMTLI